MKFLHLCVGARGRLKLFLDDADRRSFLDQLKLGLGDWILGYCLMGTHCHVLTDGERGWAVERLGWAMRNYLWAYSKRRGSQGMSLRGPIRVLPKSGPEEFMRDIRYVHNNPLDTKRPLVDRPIDYVWSSQREYAGVSLAGITNIENGRQLLGPLAPLGIGYVPKLANLHPAPSPSALLEHLLEASAQTFGNSVSDIVGEGRAPHKSNARKVFIRLARLEGYKNCQSGAVLHRSEARVSQLSKEHVPERWVRIARTLVREPGLRKCILRHIYECTYP